MNFADTPTLPSPPAWRVSLPVALLVAGVALSVSTACLTSAAIQSAQASRAAERRTAQAAGERAQIAQALTTALPGSGPGVSEAERLRVSGEGNHFTIEATGEFTEENSAAFAAAVRDLYATTVSFFTRLELRTYRGANQSRRLVALFTFNPPEEVIAALRPELPVAASPTTAKNALWFSASGDGQINYLTAIGAFTPENVKTFGDAVSRLRSTLPRPPRFIVTMMRPGDGPQPRETVGRFDSSMPAANPPR